MDGSSEHVRACAVHGAVPDRARLGQSGSRKHGGWGKLCMFVVWLLSSSLCRHATPCPLVSHGILCFQEPCIEEHCHDSWFPGTNLLSNLHHVINFVRVRVPETAPEVKREAPPSTSTEASSYGQVKGRWAVLQQDHRLRWCHCPEWKWNSHSKLLFLTRQL